MRGREAVAARCGPATAARERAGRGRYMEYVRTLYINVVVHSKNQDMIFTININIEDLEILWKLVN
jgi:hypothetical protein